MANTNFATDGTLGVKIDRVQSTPEFEVGKVVIGTNGRSYVYVGPAANAISAAATCTVTGAFAVNNTAGSYTADTAFATGDYGWVRKTTSPF
jgi:hypothetical protein